MKEQQLIGSLEKLAEQIGIVITDLKKYHKDKPNEPDTFQVGDEVEIIHNPGCNHHEGDKGIIIEDDGDPSFPYIVRARNVTHGYSPLELRLLKRKSLHDQIKEGGWDKVLDLAEEGYKEYIESQLTCYLDSSITIAIIEKGVSYTKLLALSKVLNEGKEKGKFIHTVSTDDENDFYIKSYSPETPEPINFFIKEDAEFALQFAEKEWKLFYNQ